MKKLRNGLIVLTMLFSVLCLTACKGNSTGQTGGAQADSGQTNVGNSGATDSAHSSASAGSPQSVGTSGTDTSTTGGGVAAPTVDSTKN